MLTEFLQLLGIKQTKAPIVLINQPIIARSYQSIKIMEYQTFLATPYKKSAMHISFHFERKYQDKHGG